MSPLITDLAYILVVAGIVTLLFKRLRQPLVLGYIVAGFLAGPHMPYMPSVSSMESIEEWSDIGVIFLMFTLGLEFSFKRIVRMGLRPVLSALMVMGSMIGVGGAVAMLFGWSGMDRLFLGGMLAMSSTTIIYKAYDDMGLRSKRFASGVLSVLILEDIFGILLMVVLSALAVSRQFQGMELMQSLLQLGFFLLLWFMVGIFVVPLFLKKAKTYMSNETLLIVSVGLCFLMAVMADKVGYSPAFGAFMMGSILAETIEAETIEKTVGSLRDLFGAVFFVSVGMMVEPSVLTDYWLPVLSITAAVILGQMVFGSLSFFLAGNNLRDAVESGFSMVQIGEFAFIIATLGVSLGVTSSFLYPIVVAVSILTTFLTPYFIRMAPAVADSLERLLTLVGLHQRTLRRSEKKRDIRLSPTLAWRRLMSAVCMQTAAYMTLSVAVSMFSMTTLLPVLHHVLPDWYGDGVCVFLTLLFLSPCIRPIAMRKNHSNEVKYLRRLGHRQRLFCSMLVTLKFGLALALIYEEMLVLPLWWGWRLLLSAVFLSAIVLSRHVMYVSVRMERTFRENLGRRDRQNAVAYAHRLKGSDLHIECVKVPMLSRWGGRTLSQLHFGRTDNIHVAAIIRGNQRINIPDGSSRIYPGDTLEVVADAQAIDALRGRAGQEIWQATHQDEHRLSLQSFRLNTSSPLVGHTLRDINFRVRYHCMVVGLEDSQGQLCTVQADRPFTAGDCLWIVGEESDLSMINMMV